MTKDKQLSVKAITFDLDDTLWPLKPTLEHAEKETYNWLKNNAAAIAKQFSLEDVIRYRHQYFSSHASEHHKISALRVGSYYEIARHSGYSNAKAASIAEQAFDVFIKLRQQVTYFEGAIKTLSRLSENYLIGALTNGNADVNDMSIGNYFHFSVSAEQASCSKPDANIFKMAQQQASRCAGTALHTQQIVHVGDGLLFDIFGANNAGFKSVWFNHGNQFLPETPEEQQYSEQANTCIAALTDLLALDFDQI